MDESITWAQLDPYGQVIGTPYTGDVPGLHKHASKAATDIAAFARNDAFRFYHHPTGRVVDCTVVTMTLPWGTYRFIPVDATKMPPARRRRRRQPWPH
jgi:hypothetical protein